MIRLTIDKLENKINALEGALAILISASKTYLSIPSEAARDLLRESIELADGVLGGVDQS